MNNFPQEPPRPGPDSQSTERERARNITRTGLLLMSIVFANFLLALFYFVARDAALAYLFMVFTTIAGSMIGVSLLFSWLGKNDLASWTLIASLLVLGLCSSFFLTGMALLRGMAVVLVSSGLGTLLLPRRQARLALILAVLVGFLVVSIDLAEWETQQAVPEARWILPIFFLGLISAIGYLVWRKNRQYSVRTKLVAAFMSVTLLSVGALAWAANIVVQREINQVVAENLQSVAGQQAGVFSEVLRGELRLLETLGGSHRVQSALLSGSGLDRTDRDVLQLLEARWQAATAAGPASDQIAGTVLGSEAAAELRVFRSASRAHTHLILTDRNGATVAATHLPARYYLGDEAWWQHAFAAGAGDVYIGQPETGSDGQSFAIPMAVPIYDRTSRHLIGVLHSLVSMSVFDNSLSAARFNRTGQVDLLIPGELRIHPGGDPEMAAMRPETLVALASRPGPAGRIVYAGEPSLVSIEPLFLEDTRLSDAVAALGWFAVAHQAQSEALAPAIFAMKATQVVVMTSLLLATGSAMLLSRFLVRPIERLTHAANQIRTGDLDTQVEVKSKDELGVLAETFNGMAAQIRGLIATLEERIAARTRALSASTEVSRRLSTILEEKQLVFEVVDRVRSAFDYYHAQIYLWDQAEENLVMVGGTGEAGRIMLESGHAIPRDKGLVGRAARTGSVVLVPDTVADPDWLPNVLLPETRAEVAVPILIGDRVLGVLDVQHNQTGGLQQTDADLLQSIAGQFAIALQNARAYDQVQERADREALLNEINQKIQDTRTVEEAMQTAVRELGRALQAPLTHVQLGTETTGAGPD